MTIIAGSIESGDVTLRYNEGNMYQNDVRYVRDSAGDMFFTEDTPFDVIDVLKRAKYQGFRIRIHYGNRETGRSDLSEFEIMGTIGSSMGPLKVPLLIQRAYSMGGGAISTGRIVRIQSMSGKDLYRHPTFYVPSMRVVKRQEPLQQRNHFPPLTHEVWVNEEAHAAFASEQRARMWIEFMQGNRQRPW